MDWPQLPSSGFLSGRAATNADVEGGQAVFSMDGKSEGALPIAIPQYALWTDESGAAHPVVVVQAEKAPGGLEIVAPAPDKSWGVGNLPTVTAEDGLTTGSAALDD